MLWKASSSQQRIAEIRRVGELEFQQVQPHQRVEHAVYQIARDQKGFARQSIHDRRKKQRQNEKRHELYRKYQCRGQRTARLVEHQKRQCKAACNAAHRPKRA